MMPLPPMLLLPTAREGEEEEEKGSAVGTAAAAAVAAEGIDEGEVLAAAVAAAAPAEIGCDRKGGEGPRCCRGEGPAARADGGEGTTAGGSGGGGGGGGAERGGGEGADEAAAGVGAAASPSSPPPPRPACASAALSPPLRRLSRAAPKSPAGAAAPAPRTGDWKCFGVFWCGGVLMSFFFEEERRRRRREDEKKKKPINHRHSIIYLSRRGPRQEARWRRSSRKGSSSRFGLVVGLPIRRRRGPRRRGRRSITSVVDGVECHGCRRVKRVALVEKKKKNHSRRVLHQAFI